MRKREESGRERITSQNTMNCLVSFYAICWTLFWHYNWPHWELLIICIPHFMLCFGIKVLHTAFNCPFLPLGVPHCASFLIILGVPHCVELSSLIVRCSTLRLFGSWWLWPLNAISPSVGLSSPQLGAVKRAQEESYSVFSSDQFSFPFQGQQEFMKFFDFCPL